MSKLSKSDSGLLQEITMMMTDPASAQDNDKIDSVMAKIRALEPSKTGDQLRLASCHFMTMYHTRRAMTIGMPTDGMPPGAMGGPMGHTPGALDLAAVDKFKAAQRDDMELGWKLLDIKGGKASQTARTARVLKIEVAQRLEDSVKLQSAFDDLMKNTLTEEETMVAFTAAPFLGDWKSMMKLGKKIESMPGGMEQLHMMSLQLPIPDFTLVYDLAKQHSLFKLKQTPLKQLKWDLFNVHKIRVKFKDVDCGQWEENRQELLQEIKKQGDIEWEDVPNCSHVHIKRMGALCQAVSFGEIPMMLNGPWFDDKIHVKGRAEMPLMPEDGGGAGMGPIDPMTGMPAGMPNPDSITILVQEEEWELSRDSKNPLLFVGTYVLKQRPELPPSQKPTKDHAPVNMTFDCEVFLTGGDEKSKFITSSGDTKFDDEDTIQEDAHIEEPDDDDADADAGQSKEAPDETLVTEFDGLELD